ncbi:GTPase family protein [Actinoplanes awajinensis]|uniref:GTPase n=1 Tax=Actinoplanes awajinensis subsp. mycoplanecinus TaxID=135947 RepID=A0A101JMG5_9ACTN|nr:hypothetical protein [Actinoplanes awajinensis]KUL29588.1 hypothetical protein ADL15_27085 [Actinoplanes awajinensis subsp. mycoplanecinus]
MSVHLPTIGVVGVSGVGKSSTVSALFGASPTALTVQTVPGLGEDFRRDPGLLREYAARLPLCDVILWVQDARARGLALDQSYLETLRPPRDRLVFGVNQVDLIAPGDWAGGPSPEQAQHLLEVLEERKARLPGPVVGYSALRAYRLQELFTALAGACRPSAVAALRAAKSLRPDPADRRERLYLRLEGVHP